MPIPQNVAVSYALAAVLVLGMIAGGLATARRWLRNPRHTHLFALSAALVVLAARCASTLEQGVWEEAEKVRVGRQFGLDYAHTLDSKRFPAGDLAEQLIRERATQAKVRDRMTVAAERLDCAPLNAEKYILTLGDGDAMELNVWYDRAGYVQRALAGDSADTLPRARCSAF